MERERYGEMEKKRREIKCRQYWSGTSAQRLFRDLLVTPAEASTQHYTFLTEI